MPTKTKTSKTRTRMKKLPAGQKNLSKEQKKKVRGGLLPANTVITPSGGSVINPIGSPIRNLPRYTVASPMIGAASQLLDSEFSATN